MGHKYVGGVFVSYCVDVPIVREEVDAGVVPPVVALKEPIILGWELRWFQDQELTPLRIIDVVRRAIPA